MPPRPTPIKEDTNQQSTFGNGTTIITKNNRIEKGQLIKPGNGCIQITKALASLQINSTANGATVENDYNFDSKKLHTANKTNNLTKIANGTTSIPVNDEEDSVKTLKNGLTQDFQLNLPNNEVVFEHLQVQNFETNFSGKKEYLSNGISTNNSGEPSTSVSNVASNGSIESPDSIIALLQRTGYSMIQENGQRRYGGPPPGWHDECPSKGCEIFVGKIPRDLFEDELVPLFESVGRLYELRLMMDFTGANRGYAFVMFTNREDARNAIRKFNNYEIRRGKFLGVCPSVDNCRLFVGAIPRDKSDEQVKEALAGITDGVTNVILYPSAEDKTRNRGYAFVEYDCHKSAAMARRKLAPGKIQIWGKPIIVDWAEPEVDVDDEILGTVKILYVRNLTVTTTEETIRNLFTEACGGDSESIERVKKIKDYAFVHFSHRELAMCALVSMNGTTLEGSVIEVCWAKPIDQSYYNQYSPKPRILKSPNKSPLARSNGQPSMYYADSGAIDCPNFMDNNGFITKPPYKCPAYGNGLSVPYLTSPTLSRDSLNTSFAIEGDSTNDRMIPLRAMRGAGGLRGNPLRLRGYRPQREKKLYEQKEKNNMVFGVSKQGDFLSEKNIQVLDNLCLRLRWSRPEYKIENVKKLDNSKKEIHLYVGKVRIINLNSEFTTATQMGLTALEAKIYAADHMINAIKTLLSSSSTNHSDFKVYEGDPLYKSNDRMKSGIQASMVGHVALLNASYLDRFYYPPPAASIMSPTGPWNEIGHLFVHRPQHHADPIAHVGNHQTSHPNTSNNCVNGYGIPSPTTPNGVMMGQDMVSKTGKRNSFETTQNGAESHKGIYMNGNQSISELYSPTSPTLINSHHGTFIYNGHQETLGFNHHPSPHHFPTNTSYVMMLPGVITNAGHM